MVSKTRVEILSDISGESDAVPVGFSFESTAYSVDLTRDERAAFAQVLAPYIEAGRKVAGAAAKTRGARATSRSDLNEIRAWARQNGYKVSDRGRIAAEVVAAYDAR